MDVFGIVRFRTIQRDKKMKSYYIRMRDAFTLKFIFLLFITQCFIKGIVFVVFTNGVFPLLREMGIDAVHAQIYGALALSPWTVKPLIGILSDLIAVGGYHKRYWMLISIAVGVVGAALMVADFRLPVAIVFFLVMAHFEIAVTDLLVESVYAEKMRQNPATGSSIVVLANGFQQIGFIIGMCFMGPLADLKLFRVSNIIALCLCVTPILPVLFGFLPEIKRVKAPFVLVDTLRIRKEWKIIIVVALTGLAAPSTAAITVFASKWLGLLCSTVIITMAGIGGYFAFGNRIIANVALYQILAQASRISFSSALDFFFTANPTCLPGGPAFSYKFYITIGGLVGACASLSMVFIYELLFSKWKFRSVILFATFLSGCGGLFDFIAVKRWNLLVGVPDWVMFLLGEEVIHSIVDTFYWIPSSSIIGKVCPKGFEASTYAYLAGVSNFGRMISVIMGAWVLEFFNITTVEGTTHCNWVGLEYLILGGHVILMLVVGLPISFLIPNEPQEADLLKEKEIVREHVQLMEDYGSTSDIVLM